MVKASPKDFFLHLGATIALYAGAIALINLAFTILNKLFPDALNPYWNAGSVIWPISMLIVLVPVLYVIEWAIGRDIQRMPEKREVGIRRWRIYLTLFLTGATIAGDLVYLINTYLNGEITARFVLKVLIILVVCAVIFAYYILSKNGSARKWLVALAWTGAVLILAAIVGGFLIVGSPGQQRAEMFDAQRIADLQNLQNEIMAYAQRAGSLPPNLQALAAGLYGQPNAQPYGYKAPVDPETAAPYGYSVTSSTTFEVCADFSTDDSGGDLGGNLDWRHPAGHHCFERAFTAPPVK
ncbi:MAG: hypothetical protein KGI66_00320 [Patescibacteria group bacterium]|nr:hypothetical protein [Patescibacteria group bacterium]